MDPCLRPQVQMYRIPMWLKKTLMFLLKPFVSSLPLWLNMWERQLFGRILIMMSCVLHVICFAVYSYPSCPQCPLWSTVRKRSWGWSFVLGGLFVLSVILCGWRNAAAFFLLFQICCRSVETSCYCWGTVSYQLVHVWMPERETESSCHFIRTAFERQ